VRRWAPGRGLAQERLDQEERYGPVAAGFRPVATFARRVPILIMFVAQQFDLADTEAERVASLYALGGMALEAVLAGEWWRLVAAMLLHDGPVHLLLNLGGLMCSCRYPATPSAAASASASRFQAARWTATNFGSFAIFSSTQE
jgi:hypothetical protein